MTSSRWRRRNITLTVFYFAHLCNISLCFHWFLACVSVIFNKSFCLHIYMRVCVYVHPVGGRAHCEYPLSVWGLWVSVYNTRLVFWLQTSLNCCLSWIFTAGECRLSLWPPRAVLKPRVFFQMPRMTYKPNFQRSWDVFLKST